MKRWEQATMGTSTESYRRKKKLRKNQEDRLEDTRKKLEKLADKNKRK